MKTTDGGLRDWNKTYTNYSAAYNPVGEYGAATDAAGFVAAVNAAGLCGHSDWRMPAAAELQGIVDYSVAGYGPTIDATWFPNTMSSWFWLSPPHTRYSGDAWMVSFVNGSVVNYLRDTKQHVWLVRAGQPPTTTRYTVSADGQEVTDNQTKLIWRRCAEGMSWNGATCAGAGVFLTHEAALQRAATQASSTGTAWRLPNIKELASIADMSRSYPAIDSTAFPATPSGRFWSNYAAGYVDFYDGYLNFNYRSSSFYVRLVRAGQ